jgi:hypothetical protein
MNREVRIGQLIAPFGPGAIYTDRRGVPLVVCGLDHWFKSWDPINGLVQCQNPEEFQKFEPRLAMLLHVNRFCKPADFREVRQGQQAPPNALIYTPAQRFPRWYWNPRTGEMRKFNLHSELLDRPGEGRWVPVRFVAVCAGGHLCEFPWKQWIGCQCPGDGNLYLTDRGGSDLSSITIECRTCPEGSSGCRRRNLSGTTVKPNLEQGEQSAFQQAGIICPGERPWLGEGANEQGCGHPLVGALINQINLYFPKTISAILLPDLQQQDDSITQLRNEIEQDAGVCGVARTLWNMNVRSGAVVLVQNSLAGRGINRETAQVEQALDSLFMPAPAGIPNAPQPAVPESDLLAFRRAEFNIIRNEVNNPRNIPNLRVIPSTVPPDLTDWIAKVNLVERLRETRVFYGFDRLEPNAQPLVGMPVSAMRQLFRNPPQQPQNQWLPAIEVFGEGIYIELREKKVTQWQAQHDAWLTNRLDDGFITRLYGVFQTLPPIAAADRRWATKYLLLHSLAHILINQLVFECGYSTAALRERLYVSADTQAPMAGILIYTAAGDSEGTLGGLVRLGQPDRLGPIVRRALSRASWCSADPVCSENLGGQGSRLANLAACHACVLLPETSCETVNQGLDRAMVVGTPDDRQRGLMAGLLEEIYTLE